MMKLILFFLFSVPLIVKFSMVSFYPILCFMGVLIMSVLNKFSFDMMGCYSFDYFMLDKSSYSLIMMTLWILGLMYLSLDKDLSLNFKIITFLMMLLVLMMFFMMNNLMLMYLFFELSLIPTYFMIVYWGSNPERLSASFYLLVYMLLISLPLLYYMYVLINDNMIVMFFMYEILNIKSFGWWDYLIITGAFLVKLPIYIFHVWLPKAHVEAPVYGSMILAAVLLKLGGYGLYRILWSLKVNMDYCLFIMSIGLFGSVMVSFLSMIQVDMKSLVAYSSVVHMNMMLSGLMTLMMLGWTSAMMVMISHGICSSGLFYMVNMYYERSHSRLLVLNKGMVSYLPVMSMWWFVLCSSNFSYPLSLNFFGEITLLMTVLSWCPGLMLIMIFSCFFSGAYSLYLFSYVHHGGWTYSLMMSGPTIKELVVVIMHYFPLLLIIFNLFIFY
nr:TPA_asm: NADH dehydrogenase subunit 4 [Pseudomyrmex gracilis]